MTAAIGQLSTIASYWQARIALEAQIQSLIDFLDDLDAPGEDIEGGTTVYHPEYGLTESVCLDLEEAIEDVPHDDDDPLEEDDPAEDDDPAGGDVCDEPHDELDEDRLEPDLCGVEFGGQPGCFNGDGVPDRLDLEGTSPEFDQ